MDGLECFMMIPPWPFPIILYYLLFTLCDEWKSKYYHLVVIFGLRFVCPVIVTVGKIDLWCIGL